MASSEYLLEERAQDENKICPLRAWSAKEEEQNWKSVTSPIIFSLQPTLSPPGAFSPPRENDADVSEDHLEQVWKMSGAT